MAFRSFPVVSSQPRSTHPSSSDPSAATGCCPAPYRDWKSDLTDCCADKQICEESLQLKLLITFPHPCPCFTTHLIIREVRSVSSQEHPATLRHLPEGGRENSTGGGGERTSGASLIQRLPFLLPPGICGSLAPCVLACQVASGLGECCCLPCLPGAMVALRTSLREQLRIEGNVCCDWLATCCCCPCATCQMAREIKTSC
ncbi:uncharacterized protein M6D78_012919 [Vipera latastei]